MAVLSNCITGPSLSGFFEVGSFAKSCAVAGLEFPFFLCAKE